MVKTKTNNDLNSYEDWTAKYQLACKNLPTEGTILKNFGKGILRIDMETGKEPHFTLKASVSCRVGENPTWELSNNGITCIIMPKSRSEYIKKYGLKIKKISAVKVINISNSGQSLLVEFI